MMCTPIRYKWLGLQAISREYSREKMCVVEGVEVNNVMIFVLVCDDRQDPTCLLTFLTFESS